MPCHTYLLAAHMEQQPAEYRTVECPIFTRSPKHDDSNHIHTRMTVMLYVKADGAVVAVKEAMP